jgi:hypothetical protein
MVSTFDMCSKIVSAVEYVVSTRAAETLGVVIKGWYMIDIITFGGNTGRIIVGIGYERHFNSIIIGFGYMDWGFLTNKNIQFLLNIVRIW